MNDEPSVGLRDLKQRAAAGQPAARPRAVQDWTAVEEDPQPHEAPPHSGGGSVWTVQSGEPPREQDHPAGASAWTGAHPSSAATSAQQVAESVQPLAASQPPNHESPAWPPTPATAFPTEPRRGLPEGTPRLDMTALTQERPKSSGFWRRLFGRGPSEQELRAQRRIDRLQQPLSGTFILPVAEIKGGNGKTTNAVLVAEALAESTGHQVVVVSADPANGNTLERLIDFPSQEAVRTHPNAVDLYNAELRAREFHNNPRMGLRDAHEIGQFLGLSGRLRALGARQVTGEDPNDDSDTGLTAEQLEVDLEVLSRVADIIVIDLGTHIASAAFKTALKKAHGLVLVANPYRDCVSRAEVTLDVVQRRRPDLLPDKVVLSMTHIDNMPPAIDLAAINNYFQSRATHPMVTLPYDPEIRRGSAIRWQRISEASRTAALELAGPLADLFPTAVDTTSPAHRVRTSYAS